MPASIDPGSKSFKFLVNGSLSAGQINLTADLLPVMKLLAGASVTAINFQTATGNVTPTPPPPTITPPVSTSSPTITPNGGTVGTTFALHSGSYTGSPANLTAKWQRDGVDIAGAVGYSYVSVTADSGHAIRGVEHASNSAGAINTNAAAVNVTAGGSNIPLANAAALFAMLSAGAGASGGKSYILAPGDYGDCDWSNFDFSSAPVIINGQAGVNFAFLALHNVKGLTFQGIATYSFFNTSQYAIYIVNSDGVTINACTINGTAVGTYHIGVGMFVRDSNNVIVTNNTITNCSDGIDGLDCTNCVVGSNHITKFGNNAIFWTGIQGGTFEKNYISNLDFLEPGNHPDAIQISSGTARSSNVIIRYNNFEAGSGDTTVQGPGFCERTDGLTIISNCAFGASANGISVSDCTSVLIQDNFEQGWADTPRIYCRDGSDRVSMLNNFSSILPFSLHQPPAVDSTNVTISGNTVIGNAASSADTAVRDAYLAARSLIPTS